MEPVVICPRCGTPFDTSNPRVRKLTPAAFDLWSKIEARFQRGATMGPTEIALMVDLTPPTVHHHLRQLCAQGLLKRIPMKPVSNGRKHTRHLYAVIEN